MPRILLIDDSAAMRATMRAALEGARELGPVVEVTDSSSGFEALRRMHGGAHDAVIIDIHLPDIDGLELIHFIRRSRHHRDVALIVVSSMSSARERGRAFRLGAHAFVAKPFPPEALVSAVRRGLATSQLGLRVAT
ncbi:chemotaxis protein CheY [Sorangium cellulosum]|jgi:two-component system chemotaxis response regulator CheY|uniref:Chemotaxis protein CheY n=1 Tax=Sorangium cellulosum TaxID=56 RepID=A0A4V0NEC6_SORCE|nr:response regulator [Sorangium cellulosum]AUX25702.1 chemotaxis protein CheY [Sorangium cellulosum]